MQNFDELAEGYLGLVEKQKESEGKAVDRFTRGERPTGSNPAAIGLSWRNDNY